MDLDTLISRLHERANGGLAMQSDADDCREAAEWLGALKVGISNRDIQIGEMHKHIKKLEESPTSAVQVP